MLYCILVVILLVVTSIAISIILNTEIELAMNVTANSVVLICYVLALLGIMGIVQKVLLLMLIVALCTVAAFNNKFEITRNKSRRGLKKTYDFLMTECYTPGAVILCALIGVTFIVTYNVKVFEWDSFSHWALTVKDMFFRNRLSVDVNAATSYREYPPAMALWEYLFVGGLNKYNDSIIVFAYDIFLLFTLIPIAGALSWKEKPKIFLVALIMWLFPYFVYGTWEEATYKSVCIDRTMSFSMGMGILLAIYGYCKDTATGRRLYTFAGALNLAVLSLDKSTGIVLSILAVVIVTIFYSFQADELKNKILNIIILSFPFLIFSLSWEVYITCMRASKYWGNSNESLMKMVVHPHNINLNEWQMGVIRHFIQAFSTEITTEQAIIYIRIWQVPILWLLFLLLISRIFKKKSLVCVYLASIIGFVIWAAMLLIIYLFVFNEWEAESLNSYTRYMSNYFIGITLFWLGLLILKSTESNYQASYISIWIGLISLILIVPIKTACYDFFSPNEANSRLYKYNLVDKYYMPNDMEDSLLELIKTGDRVFLMTKREYDWLILRKLFLPARCNDDDRKTSFIAQEISDQDASLWISEICDYDYVFIEETTDEFNEKFSHYFNEPIRDMTLWKVSEGGFSLVNY